MVRKYITSIAFILLMGTLFLLNGCSDFLTEQPTGDMTKDRQFDGISAVKALAAGPYRDLSLWEDGAGTFNELPLQFEYFTGKAISEDSHINFGKWKNDQVTGGLLGNFNVQWEDWYQGVRDANFSIHAIKKATGVTDEQRSRALGQVRTLRALFYFNLVRYWGDVPMFTKNVSSPAEAKLKRTSLKKIYDEIIIPDLEYAVHESALKDINLDNGKVTKYVARAILADVYLTAAGYPYQEVATDTTKAWCEKGLWSMTQYPVQSKSAKNFLKKAQEQLRVLYNAYHLGKLSDLRKPSREGKGGFIFEIQYKAGVNNNDLINNMFPNASKMSQYFTTTGSFVPSMGYINSFNPNDKRRKVWFYDTDTMAQQYDPTESTVLHFDRPYLYKYYDTKAIKVTGRSGLNWPLYRYAGICLMLTEVNWTLRQLGVSVSDHDILKGINKVRARAGLPAYDISDISLKTIMAERAYELIFENKMIWDQRRTRKALIDGNGKFSDLVNLIGYSPSVYNYSYTPKHLLAPIPTIAITRNPKMTQNFGYLPRQ